MHEDTSWGEKKKHTHTPSTFLQMSRQWI